ncbi:DUF4199 domain-containing protein [uncultured Dokdonia sp.]|uniref:DUF4199 domain-containing protein n=1 Tax=uncultured Dokdonia sp. TaxID=575653 RepID=UPI0026024363|nr:DUF4199 domain-containing protein [uncultured Dokdonia sp.]
MEGVKLSVQKYALGLGLLAGITRIFIDIIPKTLDFSAIAWYFTYAVAFIFEIIFIVYALKKYKKTNGSLDLGEAARIGVIIMLILGFLFTSFAYIYDNFIDPEFTMSKTLELMESFNPEGIKEKETQFADANENKAKSLLGILTYTLYFVFLGAVISLIAGAALRTKESE